MVRPPLFLAALLVSFPMLASGAEGTFPDRPVRIVVPSAPGTAPDMVARLVGTELAGRWRQPVVAENRPGAVGTLGVAAVARAAADGHTAAIITMPYLLAPSLLDAVSVRIENDLTPIALIAWNFNLVAVPATSASHSIGDLLRRAGEKPVSIRYSSSGNGTPSHLAGALLAREAMVKMGHIPYKGAPAATTALLSGEVDFHAGSVAALTPHVRSGALRVLATTAPRRLDGFPDSPTLVELGLPGVQITDWQGVAVPKATPVPVVAKWTASLVEILQYPEFRTRLVGLGLLPATMTGEALGKYVRDESRRWNTLLREAGITRD